MFQQLHTLRMELSLCTGIFSVMIWMGNSGPAAAAPGACASGSRTLGTTAPIRRIFRESPCRAYGSMCGQQLLEVPAATVATGNQFRLINGHQNLGIMTAITALKLINGHVYLSLY